eukprot:3453154-Amphidinium_carterae.1
MPLRGYIEQTTSEVWQWQECAVFQCITIFLCPAYYPLPNPKTQCNAECDSRIRCTRYALTAFHAIYSYAHRTTLSTCCRNSARNDAVPNAPRKSRRRVP